MKFWFLLLLCTGTLFGQNLRTPSEQYAREAWTYEEFDAFIEVVEAKFPEQQLKAVENFEEKYPASELLVFAYEHEVDALRSLGRRPAAKAAAAKALRLTPNNTKVMLVLAQLLADDADPPDQDRENKVHGLVARCLEELGKLKAPRTVAPRQWEEMRSRMESEAHAANGLVSARRGQVAAAIREFEAAISLNPAPDGAQHFYLGRSYAATGRIKDALAMLAIAEKLGPDRIRKLALDAISKLQ
jgi:tetratricopeptide (TPR) repeat protein